MKHNTKRYPPPDSYKIGRLDLPKIPASNKPPDGYAIALAIQSLQKERTPK